MCLGMVNEVSEQVAKQLMESQGYDISSLERVPEGLQHWIYDVTLKGGKEVIARFERNTGITGAKRNDPFFYSTMSLDREVALHNLIREETSLPVPEVYGVHNVGEHNFLVVERMSGQYWASFLKDNNYSLDTFLSSLNFLGEDFAVLHGITFDSFGDAMGRGLVSPEGIRDFSDRIRPILEKRVESAKETGSLDRDEISKVYSYFDSELKYLSGKITVDRQKPALVLADVHARNFFVDKDGKPSGYFDLEWGQSGVPSLEMNGLDVRMINYFDEESFNLGRSAFIKGYKKAGGKYDENDETNIRLEKLLFAGHALSCINMYKGVKDGVRDTWSDDSKILLLETIDEGRTNYAGFSSIFRKKTGQPLKPN